MPEDIPTNLPVPKSGKEAYKHFWGAIEKFALYPDEQQTRAADYLNQLISDAHSTWPKSNGFPSTNELFNHPNQDGIPPLTRLIQILGTKPNSNPLYLTIIDFFCIYSKCNPKKIPEDNRPFAALCNMPETEFTIQLMFFFLEKNSSLFTQPLGRKTRKDDEPEHLEKNKNILPLDYAVQYKNKRTVDLLRVNFNLFHPKFLSETVEAKKDRLLKFMTETTATTLTKAGSFKHTRTSDDKSSSKTAPSSPERVSPIGKPS